VGSYVGVTVTTSFPNSLVGEMALDFHAPVAGNDAAYPTTSV